MKKLLVAALLVIGLLVSACGGDGGESSGRGTRTDSNQFGDATFDEATFQ